MLCVSLPLDLTSPLCSRSLMPTQGRRPRFTLALHRKHGRPMPSPGHGLAGAHWGHAEPKSLGPNPRGTEPGPHGRHQASDQDNRPPRGQGLVLTRGVLADSQGRQDPLTLGYGHLPEGGVWFLRSSGDLAGSQGPHSCPAASNSHGKLPLPVRHGVDSRWASRELPRPHWISSLASPLLGSSAAKTRPHVLLSEDVAWPCETAFWSACGAAPQLVCETVQGGLRVNPHRVSCGSCVTVPWGISLS